MLILNEKTHSHETFIVITKLCDLSTMEKRMGFEYETDINKDGKSILTAFIIMRTAVYGLFFIFL